jgi:hypothetical protein
LLLCIIISLDSLICKHNSAPAGSPAVSYVFIKPA